MWKYITTMGFALPLASGCAAPDLPQPAPLDVGTTWSGAAALGWNDGAQNRQPKAAVAWWRELRDPQLDAWVEQSLAAHPDVAVLVARLERARANADVAQAQRRPRLDAAASAARERVQRSTVRGGEGEEAAVPPFREARFNAQLLASYEVELLGRLALGQRAAAAGITASEADLRALHQMLAFEVVEAFMHLRQAEDESSVARAQESIVERLLETERARVAVGLAAREAVRQAERSVAEVRGVQIESERQRHAARARLASLMGLTAADLQPTEEANWLASRPLSAAMDADLPATVITRRADVTAAWQRVHSAAAVAERVRLERYPQLTLTGSAGFASTALQRWLRGDALAWLAQAALQMPLIDRGRQEARKRESLADMHEAYAQYRKLVIQVLGEAEVALTALRAANERVALAHAEQMRRDDDLAAAEAARRAGAAGRPAVLQAELARLRASAALDSQRYDLLLAWATAHRTLGR